MEKTARRFALKLTKESAFILLTVACAIVLPQIFHFAGVLFGVGGKLGQIFLPMYIPVLVLGFYRRSAAGAIAGALAPIVSFALTGMPTEAMLPLVTVELVATGMFATLLSGTKIPAVFRVLSVLILAKAARLSYLAITAFASGGAVTFAMLTEGIVTSLPGVAIQLALVTWIIRSKEKSAK